MTYLLEAAGLQKRFGAVVAASDVNIAIQAGERAAEEVLPLVGGKARKAT